MNTGIWKQISTLSIPDPNTFLGSYTDSFLENWTGNDPINDGKVERTAYFKDYWILNANNIWEKTTHVTFTVNTSAADEARNGIYNWAFNAGYDATQDAYFMQHGGNITPNTSFGGARTLSLPPQTNQGNSPALTTGTIQSVLAVYTNGQITVNWTNDQTKSPQLSSTVEIINSSGSVINTISEIRPEKRQAVIASSLPNGNYTARVTITDIFNQTSPSVQTSFSSGNAPIQTITITTNGPTTFCEGSSVVLTASVANSYLWNDGETTQSIKVTSSGNYFVTVTNSDRSTSISTPTRVIVNPLPSTPTISVNGAVLTSSATDGNQWYLNGTAISDASSQNYTMETLGSYTLVVTNDSGCSTSSSSYDNTDDDISIHPNPNNGLFRIEKPATMQIVEIKIYDIFGHFIYQSKTGEMNFNLQGKHTGAGIYILEVKTGPRTYKTKKFILQEP
jgi:hypothetical protein